MKFNQRQRRVCARKRRLKPNGLAGEAGGGGVLHGIAALNIDCAPGVRPLFEHGAIHRLFLMRRLLFVGKNMDDETTLFDEAILLIL
jgi:hypothetical protein